jgi:hypothetical protein
MINAAACSGWRAAHVRVYTSEMARRRTSSAILIGALLCLVWAPVGTAEAEPADCFSWEFGFEAVGVPALNAGRGGVEVNVEGDRRVLTRQSLGLGTPAPGDRFGAAVSTMRSSDEATCVDLVIGAPGVDGTGAVYIVHGGPDGFDGYAMRLPGAASGDAFGTSVMAGEESMVIAGAPGRDVGGVQDAGAVVSFQAAHGGQVPFAPRVITQASRGVKGAPESGDRFGEVLSSYHNADELATLVGVPHEDVGRKRDAGAVVEVFLRPTVSGAFGRGFGWTQNSRRVPGVAETGDRFGAAIASYGDVAIGAPGENVGSRRDAGSVTFLRAHDEGYIYRFSPAYAVTQNSRRVPGRAETGDQFGAALAGVPSCARGETASFAIASPGENLRKARDAGAVVIFDSGLNTLSDEEESPAPRCGSIWVQQSGRVPGRAERGDHLGTQVALMVSGDLAIAAPGEDLTGNAVDGGVISFLSTEGHDYIRPRFDQTFFGGRQPNLRYGILAN